jgi:phosphoribosylamine---glycine ligase
MKILVIGSGGREHALAWRLAQSPRVQVVYVAPGNGGTALEKNIQNMPITDIEVLIAFAKREAIGLTVVGPEAPLAAGVVDRFRQEGLRIFGPSKAAAQLESSKDFAKRFMHRHKIPTAGFETFSDAAAAHAYVTAQGAPIVIKADGLAAGKGVVVAMSLEEAHAAIDAMLLDNAMGDAGARVVIEEFLEGEEASFIVMSDGRNVLAMASSQDHKRLGDHDTGPNTGGMGAYSPAPVVTPEIHARVLREVIMPTINGMASEGNVFTGFLYAGLMISPDGKIKTLEFNTRMGDPETQPIMMRLKSDFSLLLDAALDGKLDAVEAQWDRRTALGVVMAAEGYPQAPQYGAKIEGLPKRGNELAQDVMAFHAGTRKADQAITVSGGRVLCITALGDSPKIAQTKAYAAANTVRFAGMQYRRDIGYRAIAGKTTKS